MTRIYARLMLAALVWTSATASFAAEPAKPAAPSIPLYTRAPDTLPGTLPEMRDPSYWIARMEKPDEVILTPDRIEAMNRRFEEKMRAPDPFTGVSPERKAILFPLADRKKPLERPGRVLAMPDVRRMTPAARSAVIREVIGSEIAYLRSIPFGNMYGVAYSPREIDRFEREAALDRVPGSPEVLDAVTVRRARIRIVPTRYPMEMGVKEGSTIRAWDMWNLGVLRIGRPVAVLHSSRSGAFLFVLSDEGWGWVEAGDIAFGDAKSISRFAQPRRFAVCTGDRAPFYCDRDCRFVSGWFSMGDRLPLEKAGDARCVSVPMRRIDGRLEAGTGWLAPDTDVHIGYLPYTRRNVVETAFKLLDNPYDWTGAWLGRSHETTWRDIFACFGFRLPYQGELFTHFGACDEVLPVEMTKEEKHARILAHEPFVTLMVSWEHVQLLLGGFEGNPIVFDNHGYEYRANDGSLVEIKRTCVGDTRQPWYFYDHPVTFLELK